MQIWHDLLLILSLKRMFTRGILMVYVIVVPYVPVSPSRYIIEKLVFINILVSAVINTTVN